MHIATEKEISGSVAKQLREQANKTQKEFWTSLGLTQSGGSRYEKDNPIPKPIRILIFAMYVTELKIDATTPAGVAGLIRLAKLQASETDVESVGAKVIEATKHLKTASRLLNSIPS